MLRRLDLHVHSHASADACDPPQALIAAARARGLDGIALTDHDTRRGWRECVDKGLAREDGLPVDGFLVVPGIEISTADGHLLAYGPVPEGLAGLPAPQVCEAVLAAGGVPAPAHPFDSWRHGIGAPKLEQLPVPCLETFNAAASSRANAKALAFAQRRGLGRLGGSDAHEASAVGAACTELELQEWSLAALLAALPQGGVPRGRRLGLAALLRKQFALAWRKKLNAATHPRVSYSVNFFRLTAMAAFAAFSLALSQAAEDSTATFDEVLARAQQDKKPILLEFTGSDWCPPCKKMQREIFSQPDFQAFAQKEIVFLTLDFPRGKKLSVEIQQRNERLLDQFGVEGFPTLVLLDSSGKELARHVGFMPGGPEALISWVRKTAKF